MRKPVILVISLFLIPLTFFPQTKRALVVAIGNYPASGHWPQISSLNDVPLVTKALQKQRFAMENIEVITDEKATKAGITKALDGLIGRSQAGDIVFIHFSSHGQQIEDDNGDETDGLDECIVPFDAVFSPNKSEFKKLADGYFRDDLFGEKVTLLRNKLGKNGDLLVILDACHSASGTRGGTNSKVRGGQVAMVSEDFDPSKFSKTDTAGVFKDNNSAKLEENASSCVIISGAQAKELNHEYDDNGVPVGSLSYAVSRTLVSLDSINEKLTYRNLFARVINEMRSIAPDQKPALEGDGIDRELFGGRFISQAKYFSVKPDESDSKVIVLDAGNVAGITVGSSISFYLPTDDTTGKQPLQKGKVTEAGNFSSKVTLNTETPGLADKGPYAFMTEIAFGADKIRLGIDSLDKDENNWFCDSLKDFQLVEFKSGGDLYLGNSSSGDNRALRFPGNGTVFADELDIRNIPSVKEALKKFYRFRYLRNLNLSEPNLSATVRVVFHGTDNKVDEKKTKSRTKMGILELKPGDSVYLQIMNTGKIDFYINMVDIQPDGKVNPIFPNRSQKVNVNIDNCLVRAGQHSDFLEGKRIRISPPYGEETFKVFLFPDAIDLEDVLKSGDKGARGSLTKLEKIFLESSGKDTGQRGADIDPSESGTIFSVPFRIVPK